MMPIADSRVQEAFDALTPPRRSYLLALRDLVLAVADGNPSIGPLTETLKWGEPSYRPEQTGSGVAVRLGAFQASQVALFVNCQTSLVDTWRGRFPQLEFSGTRAIALDPLAPIPAAELEECVELAFTYRLRGRS